MPLSRGEPARFRRYDWDERRLADELVVEPAEFLWEEWSRQENAWATRQRPRERADLVVRGH